MASTKHISTRVNVVLDNGRTESGSVSTKTVSAAGGLNLKGGISTALATGLAVAVKGLYSQGLVRYTRVDTNELVPDTVAA